MQSACQISAYARYARTPVLQLKQRTHDFLPLLEPCPPSIFGILEPVIWSFPPMWACLFAMWLTANYWQGLRNKCALVFWNRWFGPFLPCELVCLQCDWQRTIGKGWETNVLWCFGTGDLVLSSHVSLFVCNVIDSELLTRVEKQMWTAGVVWG